MRVLNSASHIILRILLFDSCRSNTYQGPAHLGKWQVSGFVPIGVWFMHRLAAVGLTLQYL